MKKGLCLAAAVLVLLIAAGAQAVTSSGFPWSQTGETVTITKEEYERLLQYEKLDMLMQIVDAYYYEEPDHAAMLDGAATGLMKGIGDVYSVYYTKEEMAKFNEETEGVYAGIGCQLLADPSDELITVTRVFKGSPAEAAGVQRGDILYRIGEDLFVVPETLQDAVDIMRGTPGTSVDVTFLRDGEEITFNLTRANITVNQVESTMLTEEIGLIAVYEFAGKVDEEFEEALNDLISRGAKGLIIDLRDNPGGWVDSAQQVGDLFMDAGDLCYLVYRDGTEDHCYPTRDGKIEIPLVTLVNENSASASEILTGALRERAGATVVGVNTYGKGIVQAVLPIGSEGAGYQITIAEYRTPEGGAVHKVGLAPDVEIPLEEGDNGGYDFADSQRDPQLKKALEVMEEKLK